MHTTRLRKLFTCSLSVTALVFCEARSHATGGGDYEEPISSFFAPEIINRPDDLSFDHGEGTLPAETLEAVNVKEWSTYLRGRVSDDNLRQLVYKMKLAELDKLIWAVEGKKNPAPQLGKEAAAVKTQLDALADKELVLRILYYLGFAKRCEPIATRFQNIDTWDAEKVARAREQDTATADKLLSASAGISTSMPDKFLQERYRFQRLRLMFYTQRYADAQKYYSANIASFTNESSVKYRFMHSAAGAFRRDNKYGQANYLYSVVFDHFAPLKRTSFMSFRPSEESDFKECLSLAKNTREKTVIWQILGVANDGLAGISKIYELAPGSDLLPLLLVREVNRAELAFFDNEAMKGDKTGAGSAQARPDKDIVGQSRMSLLKKIADEKKTKNPDLWKLAVGHLYILSGDIKSATTYLDQAAALAPQKSATADQIRISRAFAKLRAQKQLDKSLEPWMATEFSWLRQSTPLRGPDLLKWGMERMEKLYEKGGDPLRATMLSTSLPAAKEDAVFPDNKKIDQVLGFLAQPGKSAFDEFLAQGYTIKKERMLEIKALNDLYAGRWQSAADLLAQAGPQVSDQTLKADPFVIHNVDCHECDFDAKKATTYTKLSFVQKLAALSSEAQSPGRAGAQASFLLANGLYNMSYFGNARDVYSYVYDNSSGPSKSPQCNMDSAEKYYRRAMELSTDKEFKAKACFMAAKTEQNRYFNRNAVSRNADKAGEVHSPVYFKKLKDSFSDTRYYQEIIKECSYFRQYIGRK